GKILSVYPVKMTELSFYGGVETVTGSCFLLETGGLRILVDCGMFQGDERWEKLNHAPFDFDPSAIDYLILTHGHLDHTGRVPLLVKRGFRGSIICTPGTYDIAKVVLMDSARLQEEDYEHWRKILLRRGEKPVPPLYTTLDALDAIRLFNKTPRYNEPLRLNNRVTITFKDAGHILGASSVLLDIKGEGRIIFSGDIGNRNKPIIRDPWMPDGADTVIMETTYADRTHRGFEESVEELKEVINTVCRRGGNVLIPAFAVERAQDLLFVLRGLIKRQEIPTCKVYLDSPMGISVTDIMRRHPDCFDEETAGLIQRGEDPFTFPGLEVTREPEDSKKINFVKSHAIVIAGSGMCTGGRIKHHLKHNIWRKECAVVF
ncbi:MAG: MBL fold metallo-hydrolase, partial [Nitrospirae bacterium]